MQGEDYGGEATMCVHISWFGVSDDACQGHLARSFMGGRRLQLVSTQFTKNFMKSLEIKYVCAPGMNCERCVSLSQNDTTEARQRRGHDWKEADVLEKALFPSF